MLIELDGYLGEFKSVTQALMLILVFTHTYTHTTSRDGDVHAGIKVFKCTMQCTHFNKLNLLIQCQSTLVFQKANNLHLWALCVITHAEQLLSFYLGDSVQTALK